MIVSTFRFGWWKIGAPWLIESVTSIASIPLFHPGTTSPVQTGNIASDQCKKSANKKLSTLELIDCAFKQGKITAEKRLLYFYYALGNYEKLPPEYDSTTPWDGTLPAEELTEAITSKEIFCKFSPETQNELRTGFPQAVTCH